MGKTLHGYVIKSEVMLKNVVVETAFMDMYAKCGDVKCAHKLFDEMCSRNLVTWNAMLAGFVHSIAHVYFSCGQVNSAEKVLSGVEGDVVSKMIKIRGCVYNQRYSEVLKHFCLEKNCAEIFYRNYTIILPILTACTKLSLHRVGMQVHSIFITLIVSCFHSKFSEDNEIILGSAFIDM